MNSSALPLLAVLAGALVGAGLFVLIAAIRGLPPKAKSQGPSALERAIKDMFSIRGGVAVIVGILTLLITRWVVAGIGMALLAYSWRSLSGAASERKAMARLEGLATWTESLRDTIAGAVGLEQAIPASTRVADGSIREPLARLVDRLHTRVPMHVALRRFAEDLDDSSADMIIAALIINSRCAARACATCSARSPTRSARNSTCAARSTPAAGPPGAACRSSSRSRC